MLMHLLEEQGFGDFCGYLDELDGVFGKVLARKGTRADALLVLGAIHMATTMDTDFHFKFLPSSTDAMDFHGTKVIPRSGIGARGVLWLVGRGGAG